MFRPVPPDADFVALEKQELARWSAHRVFERSVEERRDAEPWVFYEGPPTANGRPGLHHVWARVYKDLFCRYQTMRGRFVARRAGWDTHGLPVEVQVEKQLGHHRASEQIENEVGDRRVHPAVPRVGADLRRRVRAPDRADRLLDRHGATRTTRSSPDYVESVWWHLQQLFDRGLLYEDLKVVPYCPRCGTALSSHELGQPERLPRRGGRERLRAPAHHRRATHRRAASGRHAPGRVDDDPVDAARPTWRSRSTPRSPTRSWTASSSPRRWSSRSSATARWSRATVPGQRLVGPALRAALRRRRAARGRRRLATWWPGEYVTTDDGTGLVHQAPAFGEVDRQIAREPRAADGQPGRPRRARSPTRCAWLAGVRPCARPTSAINDELERRGLLRPPLPTTCTPAALLAVRHRPHLLGQAELVRGDQPPARTTLLAENATIDWHPAHIRDGRFGEWLENNVDWALSRDRFWGTPLPIWRCDRRPRAPASARGGALRAGRSRPQRARPAPARRSTRCVRGLVASCGGRGPPRRAGDRRLVRLGLDARRPGRLPARRGVARRRSQFPAQLRRRGDRPDPRVVLLAAGGQHAGLRRRRPTSTSLCLGHIVDETGAR